MHDDLLKPARQNAATGLAAYMAFSRFARITAMDEALLNRWMDDALAEARAGLAEGGLPIGSVLGDPVSGHVVARGHNLRVQTGDPTAHAEVVCLRHAGRRRDWSRLVLVSTLSPCIMCTGTTLLYRIPTVVIGEHENFLGAEDLFAARGVRLIHRHDPRCIAMMRDFIAAQPQLWHEDIGLDDSRPA